jgi:hypothetical protein
MNGVISKSSPIILSHLTKQLISLLETHPHACSPLLNASYVPFPVTPLCLGPLLESCVRSFQILLREPPWVFFSPNILVEACVWRVAIESSFGNALAMWLELVLASRSLRRTIITTSRGNASIAATARARVILSVPAVICRAAATRSLSGWRRLPPYLGHDQRLALRSHSCLLLLREPQHLELGRK